MTRSPAWLSTPSVVCALGRGGAKPPEGLYATAPSGVGPDARLVPGRSPWVGRVPFELSIPDDWPLWAQSRNNTALEEALRPLRPQIEAAINRYGPNRVGVCLGTSTSGIAEAEVAIAHRETTGALPGGYDYGQQELNAPARFVAWRLGVTGPTSVISTACSSSAKALAAGARWLQLGIVDAVVVGGCDTLAKYTQVGFEALAAVASQRCNPMSVNRSGINLGEAAALFVMTAEPGAVWLAGWGETSDAHHLSAPEPSGQGAAEAIRWALRRAAMAPSAIDYVNLHGTGTALNDLAESRAVAEVLGLEVPTSSTKPLTGHTLGAAGALEAAFCFWALTGSGEAPPHWFDGVRDPALPPLRLVQPGERLPRAPKVAVSTSLAFGGSNAALVLST